MQRFGGVRGGVARVPLGRLVSSGIVAFGTLVSLQLACAAGSSAQEAVRIGGTGIGLALAEKVGDALRAADPAIVVTVLPSLGTQGGIKALNAGVIDVAIAARPMKAAEKTTGIHEAVCLKTALVFATSRRVASGIELARLPEIYADPAPRWPDGEPLKIILRSLRGIGKSLSHSARSGDEGGARRGLRAARHSGRRHRPGKRGLGGPDQWLVRHCDTSADSSRKPASGPVAGRRRRPERGIDRRRSLPVTDPHLFPSSGAGHRRGNQIRGLPAVPRRRGDYSASWLRTRILIRASTRIRETSSVTVVSFVARR